MVELLVYEVITDFRNMGITDIQIDDGLLVIDWVDDLEYMTEVDEEDTEEENDSE
tara:strand:- start:978 stop:1142 length:165 start_codon:yes stop_codon:yes gene_type:complete